MDKITYKCETCGEERTLDEIAITPECCGGQMMQKSFGLCAAPHDAETYRAQNADDACRDGTR